jgi:Domain of unknown function (DUF4105)
MKKILFVALILLISSVQAQTILSPQAEVSMITCGPYQGELYSAFGHSAIRVYDPVNSFDVAYNYGVFDFNQPNFYLNFTRGFLYYKLGVYSYPDFRDHYISYNRYVHEQVLQLDSIQKQKVFGFLENNALPQNQTYRYDYFYNNCASMRLPKSSKTKSSLTARSSKPIILSATSPKFICNNNPGAIWALIFAWAYLWTKKPLRMITCSCPTMLSHLLITLP